MRKKTGIVLLVVCVLAASAMLAAAISPTMFVATASTPAATVQDTNCTCKAMSTTTTYLGASAIMEGQSIMDNATVTGTNGNYTPTGMVSFQVSFENGNWTTFDANVNLVNGTAVSTVYMPAATGNYSFKAMYMGDNFFNPSTSGMGTEKLTVSNHTGPGIPVGNSTTTTWLGATNIMLGQSVTDNATVMTSPGANLSGSVTFMVQYNEGAWMVFDSNVTLVNGSAVSVYFTPTTAGTYEFKANYSGDVKINGSSSNDDSEILMVSSVVPPVGNSTTMTWLGAMDIMLGQSVTDNATVTAAPGANLSGSVTFMVQYNAGLWMTYDANVTLVNGTAVSVFYMPAAAGMYQFKANYSGNANLTGSSSMNGAEMLNVTSIVPPVTRCVTVGEGVTDNATVMGMGGSFPGPTGMVDFQVMFQNGTWMTYDANVTLVNGSAVSTFYTPMAPGNYWFRAMYSGDNNYLPSMSGANAEPLCVEQMKSITTTMLSSSNITLGNSIIDNATVSSGLLGSPVPTGTIEFQSSFNGGNWTMFGTNVTLANGTATSVTFTPFQAGNYSFRAIYSGDSTYLPSMSANGSELLLVKPGPTGGQNGSGVVTMLSQSQILIGGTVNDTAIVTGLGGNFPIPTGTINFQVSFDNGTYVTYDGNVTLVNGTAMSTAYMPMNAGNYTFRAVYSGDVNYLGAISGLDNELLTVVKAPSTTTTNLGVNIPVDDDSSLAF